jgi:hypothetical protein
MSSIIEYQWIKVYKDEQGEDRFIPQFRDDGTQQFWTDTQDIRPYKLVITPIGPTLADKLVANKIPAISVPLPKYTFFLQPDDQVKAYWDNEIEINSHYECSVCGNTWQHMDSSKFSQCPRCQATDIWFCRRCPIDVSKDLLLEKERREIEFESYSQKLAAQFATANDQDKTTIREKQITARKALDEWEIANQVVKIIDQSKVRRNSVKDEKAGKGKRGEINCPDCDIPYGLNRKNLLYRVHDVNENTDYVILVEGKFKLVIKQDEVIVESL